MRIVITDKLVSRTAQEGSAIPFALKVYDDSADEWALTVPTTLRYRVDSLDTGTNITDWTTVTPDDETTITVTGTTFADNCVALERRQIVVEANHGLSTACVATREFWIRGLVGVTA